MQGRCHRYRSITIEKTGIVTGSSEFKITSPLSGTGAVSGQTDLAKDASDVASALNNVDRLYVDGDNTGCVASTLGVEFANNYASDDGGAGGCPENFGRGTITLSGSLAAKTDDEETDLWKSRNKNGSRHALASLVNWPDGRWMVVEITRAVISSHEYSGDEVVENTMEYTAEGDSVTGATIQVFRNW